MRASSFLMTAPLVFVLGCSESQPKAAVHSGRFRTLQPDICADLLNRPTLGLINIPYQSEYNSIKIDGVSNGLVTSNVMVGSPADLAGVPIGVVIIRVNGKPVTTPEDLSQEIYNSSEVQFDYVSNHSSGTFDLTPVKFKTFMKSCTYQFKYDQSLATPKT